MREFNHTIILGDAKAMHIDGSHMDFGRKVHDSFYNGEVKFKRNGAIDWEPVNSDRVRGMNLHTVRTMIYIRLIMRAIFINPNDFPPTV